MRKTFLLGSLLALSTGGVALLPAAAPPAERAQAAASVNPQHGQHFTDALLLHLPGIAGHKWVDDQLVEGIRDAGYDGAIDIDDWTGDDPGLGALRNYKRNQVEAARIAEKIVARRRAHPDAPIILTAHSGGTGLIVWALEKLPDDVKVNEVILLASALSPAYDLSPALAHVRGTCYAFISENDVLVLGAGTRMFGTIDGKRADAAGEFGFVMPDHPVDAKQYEKLVQKPYEKAYMQYRNLGDHIGCMLRPFARNVVGPLVVGESKVASEHAQKARGEAERPAKS